MEEPLSKASDVKRSDRKNMQKEMRKETMTAWKGGTKAEGKKRNYWDKVSGPSAFLKETFDKKQIKPRKLETNTAQPIKERWLYSIFLSLSCRNSNDVFYPTKSQLFSCALTRTDK